jgi:hypothetical protein
MFRLGFLSLLAAINLLSGCGSYAPPKVDDKTGMYKALATVKAGSIRKTDAAVDFNKYRFVLLSPSSNAEPARFEFFVRAALANLGFKHIYNVRELQSLVNSEPQLSQITSLSDPLSQQRISERIGPILGVEFSSQWPGGAFRDVSVKVFDLSEGAILYELTHSKMIWIDVDSEAHYPVLNALKEWVLETKTNYGKTKL